MRTIFRYFLILVTSLVLFTTVFYLLFIDYPVRFKNESDNNAFFRVIQGRGISRSQMVKSGESFIYVPTSGHIFSVTVTKVNANGDACDGKLESHKTAALPKSRVALACCDENQMLCKSSNNILSQFLGLDVIYNGEKIWVERWVD